MLSELEVQEPEEPEFDGDSRLSARLREEPDAGTVSPGKELTRNLSDLATSDTFACNVAVRY